MLLAERLRRIRLALGLTQREVGERIALVGSYVSRVENGYCVPTVEVLQRFARAFSLPVYAFFLEAPGWPANTPPPPADPLLPRRLLLWLSRMDDRQRELLLDAAHALLKRRSTRRAAQPA